MKPTNRLPRKLRLPSGSHDENEAENHAIWLAYQFTSRRKLATLERLPAPHELLHAMELLDCFASVLTQRASEPLMAFRRAALSWEAGAEVPEALIECARAFFLAIHPQIPQGGWDASDGYPRWEQDGKEPAADAFELGDYDSKNPSHRARRLAMAFADVLNVGAMLAAPKVWATSNEFPSRDHLLGYVDAFLAAVEGGSGWEPMLDRAEQLRSMLASWEPGPEIPEEISRVARDLMEAVGAAGSHGG